MSLASTQNNDAIDLSLKLKSGFVLMSATRFSSGGLKFVSFNSVSVRDPGEANTGDIYHVCNTHFKETAGTLTEVLSASPTVRSADSSQMIGLGFEGFVAGSGEMRLTVSSGTGDPLSTGTNKNYVSYTTIEV